MLMAEFVQSITPGTRLYISNDTWVDKDGNRRYTGPLTDAQMLAYWGHEVIKSHYEATGKLYCVIYAKLGGDTDDETQQTIAEPAGA